MNTEQRQMICKPDEAGVDGNSTVALQNIQSEPYESPQYSFVDRVCEFLERYATQYGSCAEILQYSHRREPPRKSRLRVNRN